MASGLGGWLAGWLAGELDSLTAAAVWLVEICVRLRSMIFAFDICFTSRRCLLHIRCLPSNEVLDAGVASRPLRPLRFQCPLRRWLVGWLGTLAGCLAACDFMCLLAGWCVNWLRAWLGGCFFGLAGTLVG